MDICTVKSAHRSVYTNILQSGSPLSNKNPVKTIKYTYREMSDISGNE